jgi:hypothetical protein
MARKTTNAGDLYIGTAAVQHINSITYTIPDKEAILSNPLHNTEPDVIGMGGTTTPRTIELNVDRDSVDTNGQVALETAFAAGTTVVAKFYPDGKVTGSVEWSGNAYVTSIPSYNAEKNTVQKGTFKLSYASTPTKGVAA